MIKFKSNIKRVNTNNFVEQFNVHDKQSNFFFCFYSYIYTLTGHCTALGNVSDTFQYFQVKTEQFPPRNQYSF